MNTNNIRHTSWDYFLVFMFLATSGAVFWHGMSPALAFTSLLLLAWINTAIIRKDFGKVYNNSFHFINCIFFLCVLNYICYTPQFKDNSEPAYIVILIASYLIVSRYDFYYFRKLITNVVYVITLLGLIVFGLFELGILPTYTLITPSGTPYTMFLTYTLGWPNAFERYSGIWHEPGAGQIVTNTILWLYYKNFVDWKWGKGELKKIFIISLGSIFSFSTGGYLVLMLLVTAIIVKIRIRNRYKYLIYIFVFLIAIIGLYSLFNSPVIQNKLFDAEGEHISKIQRMDDIFALWKMATERPLLGYGLGSVEFWKLSDLYGNTACSSGFLTYTASLGFTWMLLFSFFIWKGIKKIGYGNATIFFFLAVILMQFNEKFIEFPITNMLLFHYASYNKIS